MLKWYQRINPFYLYDQYKRNRNMIDTLTNDVVRLNAMCEAHRIVNENLKLDIDDLHSKNIDLVFEKNKYWWGLKIIAEDKIRHERLLRETTSPRQLLEAYINIAKATLGGKPPLEFEKPHHGCAYHPDIKRTKQ